MAAATNRLRKSPRKSAASAPDCFPETEIAIIVSAPVSAAHATVLFNFSPRFRLPRSGNVSALFGLAFDQAHSSSGTQVSQQASGNGLCRQGTPITYAQCRGRGNI